MTKIVIYIIIIVLTLITIAYVLISIKDLIPNWYNGFKIKRKYKVGDNIKYKNITAIMAMHALFFIDKHKEKHF